MEFQFKLDLGLSKALSFFKGKKALDQTFDANNELAKQLYQQIGMQLNLLPYEIKEYINQGYVINPHVYTVINKIIRPASAVPHYLYEILPDKKKELARYKSALEAGDKEMADHWAKKSLRAVSVKELDKLLEQPNEFQSFQDWAEQGMGYQLLTGEEFVYGLAPAGRDENLFTKLYNMPSQAVEIKLGDWQTPVTGYRIEGIGSEWIPNTQVLHLKYFNPKYDYNSSDAIRGLSPMSALCKVVKKSNDSHTAQMRILQNGHPVGILSSGSDRGVNAETAKDIKSQFRHRYQGANNKNDVMVTSAQLNWIALGLTSVDMQLIDSDKADLESIARVYEVPLPLVTNDAATYNNVQQAKKDCWDTARLPLLTKRRDALNRWLLPAWSKKTGKNLYIDFDINAIPDLKSDQKEVAERVRIQIESGVLTPNEGRQIQGIDLFSDPTADKLYSRFLTPLGEARGTQNTTENEK